MALDDGVSRFGSSKRLPTPYFGEESNNQRATELGGSPISSHLGIIWGATSAKVKRASRAQGVASPAFTEGTRAWSRVRPHTGHPTSNLRYHYQYHYHWFASLARSPG